MTTWSHICRIAPACLLTIGSLACRSKEARIEEQRLAMAQEDAETLAPEIFDLVDQMAGYGSSHAGRLPRRLRAMGVDSVTRTTARWLETIGGKRTVVVAFRRVSGHAVTKCRGDLDVLEQLALEGAFLLRCSLTDGTTEGFSVGRVSP